MNSVSKIDPLLKGYESISLKEVSNASLMRRKDQKYIFSISELPGLLSKLTRDYRVLEIDGNRSQYYKTCYFDTDKREMYHKHHRGMANRHKVRIRRYGKTELHFLEVKLKNGKGITTKERVPANNMELTTLMSEDEFLAATSPYEAKGVSQTLVNKFNRITLVSLDQTERVTLDHSLFFSSKLNGENMVLPGLAIAEIKYEKHLSSSCMHAALRSVRITPQRFSKYAIGMALLHPDLKQNRFKRRVRTVKRINDYYLNDINTKKHA